jgi:hypothetical protein
MNWVHLIPVDSFQVGVNRLIFLKRVYFPGVKIREFGVNRM